MFELAKKSGVGVLVGKEAEEMTDMIVKITGAKMIHQHIMTEGNDSKSNR